MGGSPPFENLGEENQGVKVLYVEFIGDQRGCSRPLVGANLAPLLGVFVRSALIDQYTTRPSVASI